MIYILGSILMAILIIALLLYWYKNASSNKVAAHSETLDLVTKLKFV